MKKNDIYSEEDWGDDVFTESLTTPIGQIVFGAHQNALIWVKLTEKKVVSQRPHALTTQAREQCASYFAGQLTHFDVPLDFQNYSVFTVNVWQELQKIPYGNTISYQQLAQNLGNPLCIRAAASANGRNPFPIIIQCHRVIGKNNQLTGYALGLDRKKYLLDLERKYSYGTEQIKLHF